MCRNIKHAILILGMVLCWSSCSTGTDPGECQSLDCMPVVYELVIWQSKLGFNDTLVFHDVLGEINPLKPEFQFPPARYTVLFNQYRLLQGAGEEEPYYFHPDFERDTLLHVAPPGQYNVWGVVRNDSIVVYDSVMTPVNPVRVVRELTGETFDPSRDLELPLEGDFDSFHEFRVWFSIHLDDSVTNNVEIFPVDGVLTIPASEFVPYRDKEFRVEIQTSQPFGKEFLNERGEHVLMYFTVFDRYLFKAEP